MNTNFWLLVANGTEARVFEGAGPSADLTEVEHMLNPTGRRDERELVTDRPGRNNDPTHHRSAMTTTDRKEQSMDDFASRISDFLETHRQSDDFEALSVVAAPNLLGLLRDKMSAPVRAIVLEEVPNNVVDESCTEIQARLQRLHL